MRAETFAAFGYLAFGLFSMGVPTLAFFVVLCASFGMRASERFVLIYRMAWTAVLGPLGLLGLFIAWQVATTWLARTAAILIGVMLLAAGYTCLRRGRQRWHLLHHGARVQAEVVHLVFTDAERHPFSNGVRVRYAFRGPDGVRREGLSPTVMPGLADRWFQRRSIGVCYDANAPDRHEADVFEIRDTGSATRAG